MYLWDAINNKNGLKTQNSYLNNDMTFKTKDRKRVKQ